MKKKSCPFCKSEDVHVHYWYSGQPVSLESAQVKCEKCGARGPVVKIPSIVPEGVSFKSWGISAAICAWNKRRK